MSRRNFTGSLFFGKQQQPRILDVSAAAKKSVHSEAQEQEAFFDCLRQSAPKPPVQQRRKKTGKNKGQLIVEELILDENYLNHPLYVLTRVRHFPNEGARNQLTAWSSGIRAGALDIYLDFPREIGGKVYHGWRGEFKTLDGKPSDSQRAERLWLDKNGYFAHYYFNHVEALIALAWYCRIDTRKLIGFPQSRHAVRNFDPAQGHDARCGCELRISEMHKFR